MSAKSTVTRRRSATVPARGHRWRADSAQWRQRLPAPAELSGACRTRCRTWRRACWSRRSWGSQRPSGVPHSLQNLAPASFSLRAVRADHALTLLMPARDISQYLARCQLAREHRSRRRRDGRRSPPGTGRVRAFGSGRSRASAATRTTATRSTSACIGWPPHRAVVALDVLRCDYLAITRPGPRSPAHRPRASAWRPRHSIGRRQPAPTGRSRSARA